MKEELFDFGFTAVDEDELDIAKKSVDSEKKLNDLYESIQPLLTQLKKNPDKDYIYWPNRIEIIEQYEKHIRKIKGDN